MWNDNQLETDPEGSLASVDKVIWDAVFSDKWKSMIYHCFDLLYMYVPTSIVADHPHQLSGQVYPADVESIQSLNTASCILSMDTTEAVKDSSPDRQGVVGKRASNSLLQ